MTSRPPSVLALITGLYLAWTLMPLLVLVRLSLSAARPEQEASGFSFQLYSNVLKDPVLRAPLVQSLRLALLTTVIAVPLALGLALGVARWRGSGSGVARVLAVSPLVVPETILAAGFFITFVHLFTAVRLSWLAQLLGHVTLTLPFAMLIVLATLLAVSKEYEEAAWDLGASPLAALRYVVLPVITPAIVASAAVAFMLSLNDLVMSHFLCIDIECTTLPMVLFGAGEPTPLTSAMATLLVVISVPPIIFTWVALRWWASVGLSASPFDRARRSLGTGKRPPR